jgi:hypothetical protein
MELFMSNIKINGNASFKNDDKIIMEIISIDTNTNLAECKWVEPYFNEEVTRSFSIDDLISRDEDIQTIDEEYP